MNHPAQDAGEVYWTDGDDQTPVFQRPDEFNQLLDLYDSLKPLRILEVGTYYGGTLKQWMLHSPGGVAVSVDNRSSGRDDIDYSRFDQWADEEGVVLYQLYGNSQSEDIIKTVDGISPYDWIFIDASHLLDDVRRDWNNYGCMCSPGGVVVFHDILNHPLHPEIQVSTLWKQIVDAGYRTEEIVEDRSALWGGYGIVYDASSFR